MDARGLRYFVAVADARSFRAAAGRLAVSQPAVSQGIAALERSLSAKLFDRAGRQIALTPAGRDLLEPARRALADLDALPSLLDRGRGVVRGRLELGTTDVASIYVLPKVYRAFRKRHPDAELSVHVEGSEPLISLLSAGALELAIVSLRVGDVEATVPDGFTASPFFREPLEFVVSGTDPLARKRRVTLADLATVPLLAFKRDSVTRRAVDALFRDEGLSPRVAMEMSSPDAIKRLVAVGLGASVLPARSVVAEVRARKLAALNVQGRRLERILGVVRHARRTASPAAAAFLELLEAIRNVDAPA
ncbi:MAG: LysR family transcriptional regulator [bacterium]